MEVADRAVGFFLSFISLSIFTYYTFWVIILVSIRTFPKNQILLLCELCIRLLLIVRIVFSAICRQWSLHPPIFPSPRVCHTDTSICWSGASLLLMHIYRVCDTQVQKEEGMMHLHCCFHIFKNIQKFLSHTWRYLLFGLDFWKMRAA